MSRWAQAAPSTNSLRRNAALMDPACPTTAVFHVGDVASDQLFVFIEHRQLPEFFACLFSLRSITSPMRARRRCPWRRCRPFPRVVTMAPVNVAMSTSRVMPRSRARHSASASTRRPSASVLIISMVLPFMAVTTSPGRWAEPPGMFSVAATMPVTLMRGLSCADDLHRSND